MSRVEIEIRATPKERPRVGHGGVVYTPRKTKQFEEVIAWHYKKKSKIAYNNDAPLQVDLEIYFKKPLHTKQRYPIKATGDIDNIIKAILDGLNKVAYNDDSQVVCVNAKKMWADKDLIIIDVKKYQEEART